MLIITKITFEHHHWQNLLTHIDSRNNIVCLFLEFIKSFTVKNEVKYPCRLLALLPVNNLGCRFDLESDSHSKNVTLKHKVDKCLAYFFYNLPAFPKSNKLSTSNPWTTKMLTGNPSTIKLLTGNPNLALI